MGRDSSLTRPFILRKRFWKSECEMLVAPFAAILSKSCPASKSMLPLCVLLRATCYRTAHIRTHWRVDEFLGKRAFEHLSLRLLRLPLAPLLSFPYRKQGACQTTAWLSISTYCSFPFSQPFASIATPSPFVTLKLVFKWI